MSLARRISLALLLLVLVYTVLGGMLSVLVTDWLQFVVMSAGILADPRRSRGLT